MQPGEQRTLVNFGGNRTWRVTYYRPRDEKDVLEILTRHRGERIRAFGALHSWSDIAMVSGVALDLSALDAVQPLAESVRVGAGCRLEKLLAELHAATGRTLPTVGAIQRQTLAGILSTATHGSGMPSLSHFAAKVRLARYDAAGTPQIVECVAGDELRAARCALGCMGVILSVDLATVPKYFVRETIRRLDRVDDALRLYGEHPLTQFALVPHAWSVIAWARQPAAEQPGGSRLTALLFRFVNAWIIDRLFHWILLACIALGAGAVRALLKMMPCLLLANMPRVDEAEHVLTLRHELFQHEEMEMFVRESRMPQAAEVLEVALKVFAGDAASFSPQIEQRLREAGLYDELIAGKGTYLHHYPIVFRRILPEDALLSMAGLADEAWFSASLFSYRPPHDRESFYAACSWFARAMHALLGARLHWGKHFPDDAPQRAAGYPGFERFRQVIETADPDRAFRNEFTDRMLQAK